MIIHIVYDGIGNIRSLVVPGPNFGNLEVVPKKDKGEQVTSIMDEPDLQGDALSQHLHELRDGYRIDIDSRKLVPKVL